MQINDTISIIDKEKFKGVYNLKISGTICRKIDYDLDDLNYVDSNLPFNQHEFLFCFFNCC